MSLADEVDAEIRRPGNACVMRKLREKDPELHAEVAELLDKGTNIQALVRVMQGKKHPELTRNVLQKHAMNDCVGCRDTR